MRALLALAFLLAACDQTPLDVPPRDQTDLDGTWTSPWVVAGQDGQGTYSTRYVLVLTEDNAGHCTGQLSCECTRADVSLPPLGTHFWEGSRSNSHLTMQSTNLVTGDSGILTASINTTTMAVEFSWGETLTFSRTAD